MNAYVDMQNIVDVKALTTTQLSSLTGRSRQSVHAWYRRYGLPRNQDGTYNLRDFLKWFEEHTVNKLRHGKTRCGGDPLRAAKAEKIQLETRILRKELFEPGRLLTALPGKLGLSPKQVEDLKEYLTKP